MAERFAGLSLGIDISSLREATKALKEFKGASQSAGDSAEQLAKTEQDAAARAKEHERALKQAQKQLQQIQRSIDPTAAKYKKLEAAMKAIQGLSDKGLISAQATRELAQILDTQNQKLEVSRMKLTDEGRAALAAAKDKQKAEVAGKRYIQSLERQAAAASMTAAEFAEYRAAQLGVTQQAAPFIAKLREQEAELQKQTKGMNLAGLSAKQYQQAMRFLPMQITDVVTSLASGMPVWLVAIQQGGQIKDSFGGVGNTFKALGSIIKPTMLLFGSLAATLGVAAKAAYDYVSGTRALQRAIILSGNAAGITAKELNNLASKAASAGNASIGSFRQMASELVRSGNVSSSAIKKYTATLTEFSELSGESIESVAKKFTALEDKPVQSLAAISEAYGFVTEAQMRYVIELEKAGKHTEAVAEAQRITAEGIKRMNEEMIASMSPLEQSFMSIKKVGTDMWSGLGEMTSYFGAQIADGVLYIVKSLGQLANYGGLVIGRLQTSFGTFAEYLDKAMGGTGEWGQEFRAGGEALVKEAEEFDAKIQQERDEHFKRLSMSASEYTKKSTEQSEIRIKAGIKETNAVKKLADEYAKSGKKQKERVNAGTRIQEQYEKEIIALQVQLKVLKEHKDVSDKISKERKALWAEQARMQILEEASRKRNLTTQEMETLENKKQILAMAEKKAELGDQIAAQERLNRLLDRSNKFVEEQKQKTLALTQAQTLSERSAQREQERAKIKADYSDNQQAMQQALTALDQYYAAEDAMRLNWVDAFKSSWAEFGDDATNVYESVKEIGLSAMNGLSDQLSTFLTEGKANFKDFARSIINMIVQMITKMAIFNAMSGMMKKGGGFTMSDLFSGFGKAAPAPAMAMAGGVVSTLAAPETRDAPQTFSGAMRSMANVRSGSINAAQSVAASSGGVNLNIGDISVDVNNGNDPRGIESGVKLIVSEEIAKMCGQSGRITNFINEKMGRG